MDEYLEFAKRLAAEAGEIMLQHFTPDVEHRFKEDKTIVTVADEKINRMVIEEVARAYPDQAVLGEEASNDKRSELAWICDPIDGTRPYSLGIPVSTFSLALARDGRPILGVILDPFTSSLYWACQGKGAYMNEQKISVSAKALQQGTTMNVDSWSSAKVDMFTVVEDLAKNTQVYVLSLGSVVRASTLVASGRFEGAIFPGRAGKFVDIAAAKIIVEEAGGKVTSLTGGDQRYDQDINGAIISNGAAHAQLVEAVGKVL